MLIHNCEQGTEEWFALRAGIPTASNFSKLVTSTGARSKSLEGYAITLAGEKYAGKPLDQWNGNQWTERGKELEDAARAKYEMRNDVDAEIVGFITDDDKTHGCSPDSLIGKSGMLEIKSLKAENHISAIMYYKAKGKPPTTYIPQTQGQIMTAKREWCDLMFYHPDLPELIIRIYADIGFHSSLQEQIHNVTTERNKIMEYLKC